MTSEANIAHPDISIVLTVVDGGETLRRCLDALAAQQGGVSMEVLVPYDHLSADVAAFVPLYPQFTFMDLGEILGGARPTAALAIHDFFDTRRTEALKVARGEVIGILEDRGVPDPRWAETMVTLHRENRAAVIGGAVENGFDRIKNWAIFFCDLGRYQPPLSDNDPEYVTDTNIAYKRDAIMSVRHLWEVKYQEAPVNWALRRAGYGLMLTDKARTVQHRPPIGLGAMIGERVGWGRLYGRVRGRDVSRRQRFKLCLGMPLLPFVLFFRHLRRQISKGHHIGAFLKASPLIFLLLVSWAVGELTGYLETKPASAGT